MRLNPMLTWPRVMLAAMVFAVWPVWRWVALRMSDGSDEPGGLLALGTLLGVVAWQRRGMRPRVGDENLRQLLWPAAVLLLYALRYPHVSPLPRALLAAAAFAGWLLPGPGGVGRLALLGLSLPVVATAQFYAGYPLRVLAAEASAGMLRVMQFPVVREGTLLRWRGEMILVDAPCNGVRMLWFGLYLAATLAAWRGLGPGRTLVVLALALGLVVAANVLRATALFFKETGIVAAPGWTHGAIGALAFAGAAVAVVAFVNRKEGRPCCG